ncbi:Diaminopimelate epimerase-like protein [Hortaea werneckii]|nr:Diaminopimelate epimerase-like protein [Hortaea werneckii]
MTSEPCWQETEDWHTEGEPFRIVQKLPADSLDLNLTVSDQRLRILSTPNHPLDHLRQSLCHEPRGHADMYGGFITPPNDEAAHFGVLFWHKDGFSTACGHGTIALGYWAIANGLVKAPQNGDVDVVIDVPSGRVTARAHREDGKTTGVDFVNVPSYQVAKAVPASVQLHERNISLEMDLTFGGAIYACVDVADLGLAVEPKNHQLFINIQRQIKRQHAKYRYQEIYDIYGVCFFAKMDSNNEDTVIQKNVVVFADGQIDRSPCGSGTAARVAVLLAQGNLNSSKRLKHYSIINTMFEAGVGNTTSSPTEFPACIPWTRGTARLVGRMNFYIDLSDPVYPGFLLR